MSPRIRPLRDPSRALVGLVALVVVLAVPSGSRATAPEDFYLQASDGAAQDAFGSSVAISGDAAVVGAPFHASTGAAYVFRRTAGVWAEETKLTSITLGSSDRFGRSVAIDGDVIVVGAPEDDDVASNAGAAYVFRYDGAVWVEEQKLTPFDGASGTVFGTSCAVSGNTILVGNNPFGDPNGVYVFTFDGIEWSLEQKVEAPAGADQFGVDVDLSGDVLVASSSTGNAYAFRRVAGSWSLDGTLEPSVPSSFFGRKVGVSGDAITVSDTDVAVYHFRYDGAVWNEESMIPSPSTSFGDDVAIDGDLAVQTSQFLYQTAYQTGSWELQFNRYVPSVGVGLGTGFGLAGDLSGDQVVVGAPNDDTGATNQGSIFIFTVVPDPDLRRGDLNDDGNVDVADPVYLLSFLFIPGSPAPECDDAGDVNDDGTLDISDAVFALSWLFVPGSDVPPAPGPVTCGPDQTRDALGCAGSTCP